MKKINIVLMLGSLFVGASLSGVHAVESDLVTFIQKIYDSKKYKNIEQEIVKAKGQLEKEKETLHKMSYEETKPLIEFKLDKVVYPIVFLQEQGLEEVNKYRIEQSICSYNMDTNQHLSCALRDSSPSKQTYGSVMQRIKGTLDKKYEKDFNNLVATFSQIFTLQQWIAFFNSEIELLRIEAKHYEDLGLKGLAQLTALKAKLPTFTLEKLIACEKEQEEEKKCEEEQEQEDYEHAMGNPVLDFLSSFYSGSWYKKTSEE